jgi:hypothetical protein
MADHVVFIGFGTPVRGRESQSVEVFNQFVEMLTGMAGDGRIESMDVCLLDPHGGDLGGFFLVRGSMEQCAALPSDEQFLRALTDALLIVENLGVVQGVTGEALNDQMGIYMESVGKLGGG